MVAVILSAAKNLLLALRSRATKGLGRWVWLLTCLVASWVLFLTCHREAPAPLPAAVVARVERQRVESAVDSAAIKHLERAATVESVTKEAAETRAQHAADSSGYRGAYVLEDSAVAALDKQVTLLDVALTKSESRATQADLVIAAVLPIAETREPPCRILWFVPCPTRRAVAVAAAGVTTVAFILIPRTVHP